MSTTNPTPTEVLAEARAFIEQAKWRFAWTLRWHPHEYTVRAWHQEAGTEADFEAMVLRIREHGYEDTFGKRTFVYLEVDHWRYWTMGNPLAETTVVNREDLIRKAERGERKAAKRAAHLALPGLDDEPGL